MAYVAGPTIVCDEHIPYDNEIRDFVNAGRENMEAILSPYELPESIKELCFNLSKALRLPLCGVDLFLSADNEHYCFEVNPSPGYSYYQTNTGQDIASAIVNYLEYGKAEK